MGLPSVKVHLFQPVIIIGFITYFVHFKKTLKFFFGVF